MSSSNNFELIILVNNITQPELENGNVILPFNTEYTLRLRNNNNKRSVVKIYIDTINVSGNGYIIPARSSIDILRHSDKDAAFKFVALDSQEAIKSGKIGPNTNKEYGVVEARYYLEKTPQADVPTIRLIPLKQDQQPWIPTSQPCIPINKPWTPTIGPYYNPYCSPYSDPFPSPFTTDQNCGSSINEFPGPRYGYISQSSVPVDGATVEGNTTGQSFTNEYIEIEDVYTSIKLFLTGEHSQYSDTYKINKIYPNDIYKRK